MLKRILCKLVTIQTPNKIRCISCIDLYEILLMFVHFKFQMGFFRRHYREIIEAEKNRKDSDESWDWVQKSQWELGLGLEEPMRAWIGLRKSVSCYLHHGYLQRPDPPAFHMWKKKYSPDFWRFDTFLVDGDLANAWGDSVTCQKKDHWFPLNSIDPSGKRLWRDGSRDFRGDHVDIVSILADKSNPQGAAEKQKFIFYKMYSILYRRALRGF